MKATSSFKRVGGAKNAVHNAREFEAKHIDKEKTADNRTYVFDYGDDGEMSTSKVISAEELEGYEREYYRTTYTGACDAQNARNHAKRQYNRDRTPDDLYDGARTKPDSIVLQIGKCEDNIGKKELMKSFGTLIKKYNNEFIQEDARIRFISACYHGDETTDHLHAQLVYEVKDEDGNWKLNQTECLKRLGFERPDPTQSETKKNNVKVAYTEKHRQMWLDAIEETLSVELDRTPEKNHKHEEADHELGLKKREQKALESIISDEKAEYASLRSKNALEAQILSDTRKKLFDLEKYLEEKKLSLDPSDLSAKAEVAQQLRQVHKAIVDFGFDTEMEEELE